MLKMYLKLAILALYLTLTLVIAPPLISSDDWLLFGIGVFILLISPVAIFVIISTLTKKRNKK
ncbi:hypothetical protein CGH21_21160 [Vibrio parahaemolyticus]|nr:hypothetical protein BB048_10225 [Vibrio parahaemolyticus]TOM93919.1 hypothetical protein CGH66_23715 [Vibrio parahaemolyticus]TON32546.1 hypothetical protein CGH59_15950 [Vibrio parahaemolyticus]TON65418.1 hypothetical protein CGH52_21860 [Vibrio parahaemolyticus]TOO09538.1 hypothetical protein CGH43_23940 [Vibrio parahaemolyticus]